VVSGVTNGQTLEVAPGAIRLRRLPASVTCSPTGRAVLPAPRQSLVSSCNRTWCCRPILFPILSSE
jgi:hypothetical protein